MIETRIKSARLASVIKALTALTNDVKLSFTKEGISVKAVDPANVAMVSLILNAEAFETFNVTDGEIALDLRKISSTTEIADKDEIIDMSLGSDLKLHIKLAKGYEYTVALLDPGQFKVPKIPNLSEKLTAHIGIKGSDFKMGIKAAEKVGDYVTFGVQGAKLFFMESAGDTDNVRMELNKDDLPELRMLNGDQNIQSLFAIDYLQDVQKVVGPESQVSIDLGTNYPVKMGIPIADGTGTVEYLLAPRVETE